MDDAAITVPAATSQAPETEEENGGREEGNNQQMAPSVPDGDEVTAKGGEEATPEAEEKEKAEEVNEQLAAALSDGDEREDKEEGGGGEGERELHEASNVAAEEEEEKTRKMELSINLGKDEGALGEEDLMSDPPTLGTPSSLCGESIDLERHDSAATWAGGLSREVMITCLPMPREIRRQFKCTYRQSTHKHRHSVWLAVCMDKY